MRIVKMGQRPPNLLHGTCRRCKTEIEFTREEATVHAGAPGDPRDCQWYGHMCPTCGEEIRGFPESPAYAR